MSWNHLSNRKYRFEYTAIFRFIAFMPIAITGFRQACLKNKTDKESFNIQNLVLKKIWLLAIKPLNVGKWRILERLYSENVKNYMFNIKLLYFHYKWQTEKFHSSKDLAIYILNSDYKGLKRWALSLHISLLFLANMQYNDKRQNRSHVVSISRWTMQKKPGKCSKLGLYNENVGLSSLRQRLQLPYCTWSSYSEYQWDNLTSWDFLMDKGLILLFICI